MAAPARDRERARQSFEVEFAQVLPWLPARADRMVAIGRHLDLWTAALATSARRIHAFEADPLGVDTLRQIVRRDRLWSVAAMPIEAAAELAPRSADVVFVSNVASGLDDGQFRQLSARVAEWLRAGGRLVQRDFVAIGERREMRRRMASTGDAFTAVYRDAASTRAIHARNGLVPVHAAFMGNEGCGERWQPEVRLQLAIFDLS